MRHDPFIFKVICLVRASEDEEARSRVSTSLTRRGKACLAQSETKIICYASSLGSPNLSLSATAYNTLETTVTHIVHSAWAVNFSLPLESFEKDHIAGLHNLLTLTISSTQNANIVFCSSTASVLSSLHKNTIPETVSLDPREADILGYSRSKWVAESLCHSASQIPEMKGRVKVLRIGQLTGDTKNGIWNPSEAWPLMLSTVDVVGCLPLLEGERLGWVSVDTAAGAVVDVAFADRDENRYEVFHLVNNVTSSTPSWEDLLDWVQKARAHSGNEKFEFVEPSVWLRKLRDADTHPAQALLGLWERAYGGQREGENRNENTRQARLFETRRAKEVSERMRGLKEVDEELVGRIWGWLEREMKKDKK
jgi:thioester reductase-like protein